MKLDRRYTVFLGGLPDTASIIPDSVASKAPYIGCMRDVLIVPALTDFNEVSYKAGVELGTCKSEMPKIDGKLGYPTLFWSAAAVSRNLETMSVTFPLDDNEDEEDTSTEPTLIVDGKDDLGGDEDEQDPWTITEAPQTSDRYGECMMPVTPALDPDLSPQSGMRFGKTGDARF